uniref:Rho-GAP domain-containing protein n=1 Tax=Echinostoma caproni TaxID=27848 RepID=A0A183BC87_9TREM
LVNEEVGPDGAGTGKEIRPARNAITEAAAYFRSIVLPTYNDQLPPSIQFTRNASQLVFHIRNVIVLSQIAVWAT